MTARDRGPIEAARYTTNLSDSVHTNRIARDDHRCLASKGQPPRVRREVRAATRVAPHTTTSTTAPVVRVSSGADAIKRALRGLFPQLGRVLTPCFPSGMVHMVNLSVTKFKRALSFAFRNRTFAHMCDVSSPVRSRSSSCKLTSDESSVPNPLRVGAFVPSA